MKGIQETQGPFFKKRDREMGMYKYLGYETGQGWTIKALLRPYQDLIKGLLGSLEALAVHPWAQEFLYSPKSRTMKKNQGS